MKIQYKPNEKIINGLTYLTEVKEHNDKGKYCHALFLCICGRIFEARVSAIKRSIVKSCGCRRKRNLNLRAHNLKQKNHNLSHHPLYAVWVGMMARCYNKKNLAYKYYGGRHISICPEWLNDFESFYDWAISKHGEGLQIDRINNDGNYEPSNCRFVTPAVNNKNKRNTKNN